MKKMILAICLTCLVFSVHLFAMVEVRNPDNPLVVAIIDDQTKTALDLIKTMPSFIFQTGRSNTTPLMAAAYMGNLEVVKALLAAGASAATETDDYHDNALSYYLYCCSKENVALTMCLVSATPNLDKTNHWKRGNFMVYAAKKGFCKAIELLAQAGFNVDEKGCYYKAPLIFALYHEQEEAVKMLIKCGADVNKRDELTMTPLMNAALVKNKRLTKILRQAGAESDATTTEPINVIVRDASLQLRLVAVIWNGAKASDLAQSFKEPVELQTRELWYIRKPSLSHLE